MLTTLPVGAASCDSFGGLFGDGNKEEETPPEEETPGEGNEGNGPMGIPENDKYEGWGSPIMVQ